MFKTSDIVLAASLAVFFPITGLENGDMDIRKKLLCFDDSKELLDKVRAFNQRTLLVSPREFYYALREVKARLFAGQ